MRVLKIQAEGLVASFRYPHFVQGMQLTYEMPPPATIYGQIGSAVGDYLPPMSTQFAYHFTSAAKFVDYEHLHFFGKTPKMNPFERELLFQPRLTLYLTNVALKESFLRPHYAAALGRAQDLITYVDVREIELLEAEQAFYANTLLRIEQALQIGGRTYSVTMPRFIDEDRVPVWDQYALLLGEKEYPAKGRFQFSDVDPMPIWVDPEADASHLYKPLQRGIIWHSWQEG